MGSILSKLWNDLNHYYQSMQTVEHEVSVDVSGDNESMSQTSLIGETSSQLDDTNTNTNVNSAMVSDLPESRSQSQSQPQSQSQTPTHKCEAFTQKLNSMKLSFEDPRSPTYGIERTPIELMLKYESLGDKLDAMRLSFGNACNITQETDEQSIIENN